MDKNGNMTGEDYIGDFNPSERKDVADVKFAASQLIDLIWQHGNDKRRNDTACTQVELAAMMDVKSIFSK